MNIAYFSCLFVVLESISDDGIDGSSENNDTSALSPSTDDEQET